jgi:hypothetical protein
MRYHELLRREALEAHSRFVFPMPAQPPMLWPFAGSWTGSEQRVDLAGGTGGVARGVATMRVDLNGRVLMLTRRVERDGHRGEVAYAVMALRPLDGQLNVFWFDAVEPGAIAAPGIWTGERLSFTRITPRGLLRHSYTLRAGTSYTVLIEGSVDGGRTWRVVSEGTYVRAGS